MPLPCPACRPARNWHFSRQCILRLPRRKRCVFSKPPVTAVTRTICFFWFFPCQSWNPIFSNSVSWSWKKSCNTSHVGIRSSWAMAKLSKSSSAPLGVRLPIASDENCVTICHYLSLSVHMAMPQGPMGSGHRQAFEVPNLKDQHAGCGQIKTANTD